MLKWSPTFGYSASYEMTFINNTAPPYLSNKNFLKTFISVHVVGNSLQQQLKVDLSVAVKFNSHLFPVFFFFFKTLLPVEEMVTEEIFKCTSVFQFY